MKLGLLFCLSLVLLMPGIACLGASSGGGTAPAVQDEAAGGGSDQPEPVPESDTVTDAGNNPEPPAVEWPLSFKVAEVLQLEQRKGQSGPGNSVEERLKASTLDFLADGTFTYDTSRGVSTLYPVQGKYQLEDGILAFSGSKTHSYGETGDASVNIEGEIDLNAETPVASVLVEEKTITQTREYGGIMSTDKTSAYSSELLLEPVNQ